MVYNRLPYIYTKINQLYSEMVFSPEGFALHSCIVNDTEKETTKGGNGETIIKLDGLVLLNLEFLAGCYAVTGISRDNRGYLMISTNEGEFRQFYKQIDVTSSVISEDVKQVIAQNVPGEKITLYKLFFSKRPEEYETYMGIVSGFCRENKYEASSPSVQLLEDASEEYEIKKAEVFQIIRDNYKTYYMEYLTERIHFS